MTLDALATESVAQAIAQAEAAPRPRTFGGMTLAQLFDAGWQIESLFAYGSTSNTVNLVNGDGSGLRLSVYHEDTRALLAAIPLVSAPESEVLDMAEAVAEAQQ